MTHMHYRTPPALWGPMGPRDVAATAHSTLWRIPGWLEEHEEGGPARALTLWWAIQASGQDIVLVDADTTPESAGRAIRALELVEDGQRAAIVAHDNKGASVRLAAPIRLIDTADGGWIDEHVLVIDEGAPAHDDATLMSDIAGALWRPEGTLDDADTAWRRTCAEAEALKVIARARGLAERAQRATMAAHIVHRTLGALCLHPGETMRIEWTAPDTPPTVEIAPANTHAAHAP